MQQKSIGFSGRARFDIINKKTGEVLHSHEQKNLLLSTFMELYATYGSQNTSSAYGQFSRLRFNFNVFDESGEMKIISNGTTGDVTKSVVIASAAIFAVEDVDATIIWDTGEQAKIKEFVSPTEVVAEQGQDVAAGEFKIVYKYPAANPEKLSNGTTATQSQSVMTTSAPFFEADYEGDLVEWADGTRTFLTTYLSPTSMGVKYSQNVATGQEFTLYRISDNDSSNEVATSYSDGGFHSEHTNSYSVDAVSKTAKGEFNTVRVIEFNSSANLTKWGFKAVNGEQVIKSNFKDAAGVSKVLTIESEQQLKITHTLEVIIDGWGLETMVYKYFKENGVRDGTKSVETTLFSTTPNSLAGMFSLFDPTRTATTYVTTSTALDMSLNVAFPINSDMAGDCSILPYEPASFYRDKKFNFPPSRGNGDLTGVLFGFNSATGIKQRFTPAFEKVSERSLKFIIRFKWGWEAL